MRLSTAQMHRMAGSAMQVQQTKLNKTQMQLSSMQRLLTPSDDPAASVRVLDLDDALQTQKQYQSTIGTTQSRLSFEDSALEAGADLLQRVRVLTVQGLDDTLSDSDRKGIAEELQQLTDEMAGIANTRNASGEYIFAGYKTDTAPFAFDQNRVPPSYVYKGDNHQRTLKIGEERPMADGDSGFAVFENVPSKSGSSALSAGGGKQSVLNTLYGLTQIFKGQFTASNGAAVGSKDLSAGIDYSGGSKTFDLAVDGGAAVPVTVAAGQYTSADDLAAAINAGISGSSLNGQVVAQNRAGSIEFVSVAKGATSSVAVSNDANGFLTDIGMSGTGAAATGADLNFHDAASAALNDLDSALNHISDIRASVGGRLNGLEQQENLHSKFMLDTQANLSGLRDLDVAEAITRFTLEETALQASQQAYARVQKLSLFDYL